MRTLPPSIAGHRLRRPVASRRRDGFTLIETALAIGIVAFAFVALIGLLPAGLTNFREAMDTSVGAQIVQRIAGELQETDFHLLVTTTPAGETKAGGQFFVLPLRYFDDQGNELPDPKVATAAERQRTLYVVRIRGSRPGGPRMDSEPADFFTSLPATTGPRFTPRDLTFLTIQIANNPANRDLGPFLDSQTQLIDRQRARRGGIAVRTYPVALARNGGVGATATATR